MINRPCQPATPSVKASTAHLTRSQPTQYPRTPEAFPRATVTLPHARVCCVPNTSIYSVTLDTSPAKNDDTSPLLKRERERHAAVTWPESHGRYRAEHPTQAFWLHGQPDDSQQCVSRSKHRATHTCPIYSQCLHSLTIMPLCPFCNRTHYTLSSRPPPSRHVWSGAQRRAQEPGRQGMLTGTTTHISTGTRGGCWKAPFSFLLSPHVPSIQQTPGGRSVTAMSP